MPNPTTPTPPTVDRKTSELFMNKANEYRLHLDKLRWMILAGFMGSWGGMTNFMGKTSLWGSLFWCVAGVIVYFILAVQNWHYNMYSWYVKHCEKRLSMGREVLTHKKFSKKCAAKVNPWHDSFSFVFLLIWIVVGCNISKCLNHVLPSETPSWWRGGLMLISIFTVVLLGIESIQKWKYVYSIMRRMRTLASWKPRGTDPSE